MIFSRALSLSLSLCTFIRFAPLSPGGVANAVAGVKQKRSFIVGGVLAAICHRLFGGAALQPNAVC